MKTFQYYAPKSLQEALDTFKQAGSGGRILAGGTDLVVQMKESATRFPYPGYLVSLRQIPELKGISRTADGGLRIGAGMTMSAVSESREVRQRYPIVVDGSSIVGSLQTQNLATIGGNICNAAPSADVVPALLCCEAKLRLVSPAGERTIPVEEFFTGPGQTVLQPGEVLVDILLPPLPAKTGGVYKRQTPRKQMDIAVAGVATLVTLDGSGQRIERARIALAAVAPTPIRAPAAEEYLTGRDTSDETIAEAARLSMEAARPISDVRGSADFRKRLIQNMTARMLREAIEKAKGA
ncbi:MAG TPA: xanthine dehydrogenase family protein subunit M [Dehalococcoidia bacterium]|nr:xanthine dehydrogenase family protein subunit M [Dehalococcoidia bacterium]